LKPHFTETTFETGRMFISRYSLSAFAVALLALFGLTRTDSGASYAIIPTGSATSLSSPNGVHVQVMREASSAYAAHNSDDNTGRCGRDGRQDYPSQANRSSLLASQRCSDH
jgi:hypothetical protein